mmetsp:Transcript_13488/g.28624  ORF Transcript_13488/g.28624 Transcript_13488/m.28624 type:complete len:219 (-) Transcript_13488:370-1026(-)
MGKWVSHNPSRENILKAKNTGLVLYMMIVTSNPSVIIENLFGSTHKTRVFAMFRHPVDRLVSLFYYLQEATWEGSYKPKWKDIDIHEWAKSEMDNNHLMKKLTGKEEINETDLELAKNTIKSRIIVGLMHDMEESVKRFNVVMGIDQFTPTVRRPFFKFVSHIARSYHTTYCAKIKIKHLTSHTHHNHGIRPRPTMFTSFHHRPRGPAQQTPMDQKQS